MRKSPIYLLDTMALINFTERCVTHDLFGYFGELGVCFKIVEEVKKEFFKKIKPLGEVRFNTYSKNKTLEIIPNESIKIDVDILNNLLNQGFGKGELFSALYYLNEPALYFVSDEKLVQKYFAKNFKVKLTRTYDLLTLLVQENIFTGKQREAIMDEMIGNGFWIKTG